MFPFYFRQTVPQGELTTIEMETALSVSDDSEAFAEELRRLSREDGIDGRSKANTFLKRFTDYTDDISDDNIGGVVGALLLVGDELCSVDPSKSIMDDGTLNQINRILRELLRRVENRDERLALLEQSVREGNSPYVSSHVTANIYREHGEFGGESIEEDERSLNYNQLEELTLAVVEKIREISEEGELLETPNLDILIARWMKWDDSEKPVEWVEQNTQEPDDLLFFLSHYVSQGWYASQAERGEQQYFDPKKLVPFFELTELEYRLDQLENEELDDWEQLTIELFKKGKEMLDNGREPGDFSAWRFDR